MTVAVGVVPHHGVWFGINQEISSCSGLLFAGGYGKGGKRTAKELRSVPPDWNLSAHRAAGEGAEVSLLRPPRQQRGGLSSPAAYGRRHGGLSSPRPPAACSLKG